MFTKIKNILLTTATLIGAFIMTIWALTVLFNDIIPSVKNKIHKTIEEYDEDKNDYKDF